MSLTLTNCNFSPVSATGKDLSSSSSTHYDALAGPGGSCCPPEVHSMLPAPTAAFKSLAKAFLATAYKHPHPPGLLLSPSSTQHNCEHINKPTAHAHQILPLAGSVPEQHSGDVFFTYSGASNGNIKQHSFKAVSHLSAPCGK